MISYTRGIHLATTLAIDYMRQPQGFHLAPLPSDVLSALLVSSLRDQPSRAQLQEISSGPANRPPLGQGAKKRVQIASLRTGEKHSSRTVFAASLRLSTPVPADVDSGPTPSTNFHLIACFEKY
jgi:hypothetical protein